MLFLSKTGRGKIWKIDIHSTLFSQVSRSEKDNKKYVVVFSENVYIGDFPPPFLELLDEDMEATLSISNLTVPYHTAKL